MRFIAFTLVVLASLVLAGSASASWSTPQAFTTQQWALGSVAVNARADIAVAWGTHGIPSEGPIKRASVHVIVRPAHGRLRRLQLWSTRTLGPVGGPRAAIDGRGETTVTWAAGGKLYAAYGTLAGRWSAARVVGRAIDAGGLAVSPDGDVLAAWLGPWDAKEVSHQRVAWRTPGHPFGAVRELSRPRPLDDFAGRGPRYGGVPQFASDGTAYLAAPCDGVVLIARPHSHHFGAPVNVAGGSAMSFNVSTVGTTGIASWAGERCYGGAEGSPPPGPVYASTLKARRFGPRVLLSTTTNPALETIAVAAPAGGGTVSWHPVSTPPSGVFSTQISATGTLTGPTPIQGTETPYIVDGAGDQLLVTVFSVPPPVPPKLGVRPIGGGPVEPAPVTSAGMVTAAHPVGRAFAIVWDELDAKNNPTGRWRVSVWRP